jgi:hypothetical protein
LCSAYEDHQFEAIANDLFNGYISLPLQVIQQLKAVEEAPLSLENCRQSSLILARIKVDVCAGRTPAAYILLLVHGMIGVLRNRFALLWDAAMDSLAGVVGSHGSIAWDQLLMYLKNFQELFLHQPTRHTINGHASDDDTAVLLGNFLAEVVVIDLFWCVKSESVRMGAGRKEDSLI